MPDNFPYLITRVRAIENAMQRARTEIDPRIKAETLADVVETFEEINAYIKEEFDQTLEMVPDHE